MEWLSTNWAMELSQGPFYQVWKYLCPSPVVCPCHYRVTCVLTDLEVVSMSLGHVMLACKVDPLHGLVHEKFRDLSLVPRRCAHDISDRYLLKINMDQWVCAVQGMSSVICLQAFVFANVLDVSLDGGGVMPVPECRLNWDDGIHRLVELFCGGYSGWSHTVRFLRDLEFPLETCLALDIDHDCVVAYQKVFGGTCFLPGIPNQLDDYDDLPLLRVVESDVLELSWVHLLGKNCVDVGVCSPPCPPWSKALASPPGLRRKDGALTPAAIALMALFGCKVFCLENVSGLTQHVHWKIMLEWLVFWGFDLRWAKCLDLAEIAPQRRERLLLVATKTGDQSIASHICVPWPTVGPPTLQQFDVITQPSGHWLDECTPSEQVLGMYLDPSNLPKSGSLQRPFKKNKVDVMKYRLRSPQDQMSCVMANYSFGHELPDQAIQQGGLYGAILALPSGLRFCSTVEVALLQMPLGSVFLPASRKKAIMILGNSISSAHAGIALLNAMAFLTDLTHVEIAETFGELVESRLKASTLAIHDVPGGYLLSQSDIAATVPMHLCEVLVLKSPVDEVRIHVQVGLNVMDVLKTLLGASTPASIYLVPAGNLDHKVPLHPNMLMQSEQTTLFASVQACLLLPTLMFGRVDGETKFVVALCTFGTVAVARRPGMSIDDLLALVSLEFDHRPLYCTDILGMCLDGNDPCPDAVVVMSMPGIAPSDSFRLLKLEVETSGVSITFGGFHIDLLPFTCIIRSTGILDLLLCMGWNCVIPVGAWDQERFNFLQILRNPNRLAIEAVDVKYCIAIRFFISHLRSISAIGSRPVIRVRIKFWSSWVWEGLWDPSCDFSDLYGAWKSIMLKFGLHWDIRFVINGHNANFERPISQFVAPHDVANGVVKIFLATSMRGGGPKMSPGEAPAASGVKRRLPSPPPMPNTHERPPTPPSVPGTPPQPPTPPLPPRLREPDRVVEERDTSSASSSESMSRSQVSPRPSFHEAVALACDDFERALNLALAAWIDLPAIDWDVDANEVAALRLVAEGHLIFWDGTFSVLLRLIHLFQQSKIEVALAKLGWIVTMQFLEFANPARGRVLIIPHTDVPTVNLQFCVAFMHAAFVVLAMPRGVPESADAVYVKVKIWGHPAFKGWLPKSMLVQRLLDSWSLASTIVNVSSNIRAVGFNGVMNPEFKLEDYAKRDDDGAFRLTVHFVTGLRGGGGPSAPDNSAIIKQKNALAAFCLGQGGDLQHVTSFVDKISKASSPATIEAVLSQKWHKGKLDAITKLAKTLNITIPDFSLQVGRRREKIRERVKMPARDFIASLDLSTVVVKESFFLNEDGSSCRQVVEITPQSTGVCLLDPSRAAAWLAHQSNLSQDELAIVVLGRCECPAHSPGKRVQIPAFCADGEPLVLSGCLHDLGRKKVSISRVDTNILMPDSVVVSFTVCKDELSVEKWEEIMRMPVKATLSLSGIDVTLLAPPWGRVFQRLKTKVPAEEATSLQFHARISKDDLTKVLQISGTRAVYTTAKSEDRKVSDDFQVVWMPHLSLVDLQVTAASYPAHRGIVRSMKGGDSKITRGLRFRRSDFKKAFSELRPQDTVPSDIPPTCVFKISPVPIGASSENVQTWLDSLTWKAKPLRLLASKVWLCAAAQRYDSAFQMWDDQPILIKWLDSKPRQDQVVIAGNSSKIQHKKQVSSPVEGPGPYDDPWAYYNQDKKSPPAVGVTPAGNVPAIAARKLEGPIEDRLKKQTAEFEDFKEQQKSCLEEFQTKAIQEVAQLQKDVSQLKEAVAKQSHNFENQNKINAKEFGAIRQETKDQFAQLALSLQDSIKQTLAKQDHSMASQFQEIKTMLQNKENPPKKLKSEGGADDAIP